MRILYHITNLPPKIPGTEASLQELNTLRQHFGGHLIGLNPNETSPVYLPRLLFGFHKWRQIRAEEAHLQAHHVYNADPFPFPILGWFKRPVIYSISSGVGLRKPNIKFFKTLAAVTVSDEISLNRLQQWGLENCFLVHPGLDTEGFSVSPQPLGAQIRLMVGSAPWTKPQFQTKGIEALLQAAGAEPHLHLIFLWRGVLLDELTRRVQRMGLENQVEIIITKVNVNQVLAKAHASITLVTNPAIIRSYPHSLIESLAAGKPILVSRSIPMSLYTEKHQCGVVVKEVTPASILEAVEALRQQYGILTESTQRIGARDFSRAALIASFQRVYESVLNSATAINV